MCRPALAAIAVPLMTLAGCVAIGSESYDEGIVYHLPRSLLTITVTQYNDTAAGRTWYQIGTYRVTPANASTPKSTDEIKSVSIPDPGHRYVAHYRPNAMSDDRLCISRTKDGLLRDVNFASDDRTPEIVFNISRFIAGALGGERSTGLTDFGTGAPKPVVRTYTGQVDPLSEHDVRAYNRAMKEVFGEAVAIDFSRMMSVFEENTAKLPDGCLFGLHCPAKVWTDRCSGDRICYRTQLEVPVDLKRGGQIVDVNFAKVINPYDIGAISVTRAFLVHKISKFRFDDGVLIGTVIRKPSEVEELSLLPLHVLYAALHTPSQALSNAFGGDQDGRQAMVTELSKLTEKAESNKTRLDELRSLIATSTTFGLAGETGAKGEVYELACTAPADRTGFINILTNK